MINFKIITFITVAKTKNFSKTAEILNITQPAVSQHIKNLEEYYNVKLLNNRRKAMELTEEGKLLYEYAVEMNRLSRTVEDALKNKTTIVKKYHIGATMTIGGYVLPRLLGIHKSNFENIDIMLYVKNTEGVINSLISGEIIMGVVEGPFDRAKFNFTKFKDDELILAVSPEHIFAKKDCVTIDMLLKDKLILREKGSGTRKIFENELLKIGYCLKDSMIYMEIGNINALVSLVESNLGCTIISREAIKESLKAGTLKEIKIKDFKVYREFNFIYFDNNVEFVDDFIDFCKKNDN
ncbi:MAG: LysR family transcriptional regulator [Clostridia bacterium]|nr:LysR family transcriptional regulator [Clostridia bacterium]MDD4047511.1 LysR family transcriptional regulator [Clostridia bacterium]